MREALNGGSVVAVDEANFFSGALVGGEPAHYDDPTIVVGAEESDEARCRSCHTVRRG